MTSVDCELARLYAGIFRKLNEDLFEAYARTPVSVSSRPYIERALRLVRAGMTASMDALEKCRSAVDGAPSGGGAAEPPGG